MRKLLAILVLLYGTAFAQAPWPGQPGNTVGYTLFGALGTSACGAITSGSAGNPTFIQNCKFSGTGLTISQNHVVFVSVDFDETTNGVNVTGTDVVFVGCRFQSNIVGFYSVRNGTGTNYYLASSFTPRTSLYTSPPGEIWPSAGTATNTLVMTSNVNAIDGNSGYQFGINIFGGIIYVDSSDFWGFGNSIAWEPPSTSTQQYILNTWIHDAANISPQGYHTDGPGFLETGLAAPNNVLVQGNTITSLGNSNAIAFQNAGSGYAGMDIISNYLSGYGNTDAPCEPGPTPCTNSRHTFNVWGTDVENYFEPLYAGTYPGTGNIWACNTLSFRAGTTWTNQNSNTPTSAIDGKYWLIHSFSNGSTFASTTDQGGNTVCPALSPSSLDFLLQAKNTTSATKTITIRQTNSGTATITTAALNTGTQFSIVSNTCNGASLTTGQTCTVGIAFAPTTFGVVTDTLKITDNMPSPASPQVVPLVGVGCTLGGLCPGGSSTTAPVCSPGNSAATSEIGVICPNTNVGTTVACFTVNGTTPATNGLGTACTTGTILTLGQVLTITKTTTVKVIAGVNGSSDSSVNSYTYTITIPPVVLPQTFVNSNEGNTNTQYELKLGPAGGTWVVGPPPTCVFTIASYTNTFAGWQAADTALASCENTLGGTINFALDIPPGLYIANNVNGLVVQQFQASAGTGFILWRSTQDGLLPIDQTVGTHGIQDNCPNSPLPSDIGIDNPDGTGQNMYYQCAPAMSPTNVITGITTLSTDTTTLAAISSTGVQCVPLANGYVAPGVPELVDSGGNQETVTTTSAANVNGMCGNFTKTHLSGVPVFYNVGNFTLANGTATNTSNYNDIAKMPILQAQPTGNASAMTLCNPSASGSSPVCNTNIGPDHRVFQDVAFRLSPGSTGIGYVVQMSGPLLPNVTSPSQLATHIHFQRDMFMGDWTSLNTGANQVSGGLDAEGIYVSLMDSMISQTLRPGSESHPVTMNGDVWKSNHNWFDSGSQGVFSGGFSNGVGPTIFGWIPACDFEMRRNMVSYPFSWLGQNPVTTNPNFGSFSTVKKNAQENKDGCRAVIEGNIFQDVDTSGAQSGVMQEINPRNNSAGTGIYYLSTVHDFTVRNNLYRHGCTLLNVTTSNSGPGGGVAYPPRALEIYGNLYEDISITNYNCGSVAGLQVNSGGGSWQGTVNQTSATSATFTAACSVDLGQCIGQISAVTITGGTCVAPVTLTFPVPDIPGGTQARASVGCTGTAFKTPVVGVFGSGYTSTPTVTLTCASCTGSPVATAIRNTSSSGIATATGFQVFNISVGDPVAIDQCQTASFNTVGTTLHAGVTYVPSGIGPPASAASAAWTGTFSSANVTVSVPHFGTNGTSESTGYCKFTTLQGAPYQLHWNHNTVVSDSTHVINSAQAFGNSDTDGGQFQILGAYQNSIFSNGDIGSSPVGTGTPAQTYWFDAANTLTMDHLVFPAQTAASYTAYGLNPIYPVGSPVMFLNPTVSTSYCSGASATSACIGFLGAMSAGSLPLNLSDYHQYALISSSVFKVGGANACPDGLDCGANIAAIDTAQTLLLYSCPGPCGQNGGPYPDVNLNVPAPYPPAFFGHVKWPDLSHKETQ